MKKILILASGSGSNAEAIVKNLSAKDVEIVIGHNVKNAGVTNRGLFVPCVHLPSPGKDFSVVTDYLEKHSFDLVVMAGYMRVWPPETLAAAGCPVINIHPSLLPKYKGSEDGYGDAFRNRDIESGCTVHLVTDDVDGGPALAQLKFDIPLEARDDLAKLKEIGLAFEHIVYPAVIKKMLLGETINPADSLIAIRKKYGMQGYSLSTPVNTMSF
ncbi:MAG: hypothetical protein LBR70_04240 [Lactobacillaceae bacterium]|jgi:folate-dependent phosphoribosylglycinamide formyltransferase PurN|nr:hypothetical protein [Lactobacillaceae bacterium]